MSAYNFQDLTGQKFNKLTVINREPNTKSGQTMWKCQCDCGNFVIVNGRDLKNGHTKSCGCLFKITSVINGQKVRKIPDISISKTRLYNIWYGMKARCYNPKHIFYYDYGGRGITICNEWKNDVIVFYNWTIVNGYQDDLSIDRIDNDGNYEPDNCKWVSYKDQTNNTSRNHFETFNNKTQTMGQWATELEIDYSLLIHRLYAGWSVEKAFTEPILIRNNPKYTFDNKTQTLTQWSKELGIARWVINNRIRLGCPIEKVFTTPVEKRKPRKNKTTLSSGEI